jgi:tetratricopeptide (TPR) repeat protein
MEAATPRSHILLCLFIIAAACLAVYSNSYDGPFVFDDLHNIAENHFMRITRLDWRGIYDAGFRSPCVNRPVANISLALNYYFDGYRVWGYHLVNVLIHLINGILVFFLAKMFLITPFAAPSGASAARKPDSLIPLFAALIFTVHPIQTQSVTYIVQRMNSMAAMFYLLALLLFLHGRMSALRARRWGFYVGCLASWIMALGSKEIAVTLPFAILLCEWYFFQDLSQAWLKRNIKYLFLALVALYAVSLLYTGHNPLRPIFAGYGGHRDFTVGERALTQFRVVVCYITLAFFPHPSRLNLLHHVSTSRHLFEPLTTFLSLIAIAGLIAFASAIARRQRLISFCILWFFGHLVLESSFIGLEMIYEHRLYLPLFGVSLMTGYLIFHFLRGYKPWAVAVATAAVLSLGTAAYLRNRVWQDGVTLWTDVIRKNPYGYRGYNNLGLALKSAGDLEAAKAQISRAIRINPNYFKAQNNMGLVLQAQKRFDEAETFYANAVRLNPRSAAAHHNLGAALARRGKYDEAIEHYQKALEIDPYFSDACSNLGVALSHKGELQESEQAFRKALALDPGSPHAHNNLGLTLDRMDRPEEARRHYEEALRLKPDFADAHNNFGFHLSKHGRKDEAIRHLKEAIRISPDYEAARVNLGNVLAETGDPRESAEHLKESLKSNPNNAEAHYNLGLALVKQRKFQEAMHHFSETLRIQLDHVGAHNNLGILLAMQGKPDQAMEQFREALRIHPRDADAHCNLGVALAGQGKVEEAVAHFREALGINPEHPDAGRNLETALRGLEEKKGAGN